MWRLGSLVIPVPFPVIPALLVLHSFSEGVGWNPLEYIPAFAGMTKRRG